mgnify:CR=1 FL=1
MDKLATEEYPEISYHLNEIAQAVHTGSFLPSNKNGHSWVMEVEGYDNQVFMFDPTADQCERMPTNQGGLPSVWTRAMIQEFMVCLNHAFEYRQRLLARRMKQIFAFQIEQAMPKSLVVAGHEGYLTV